MNICFYAPIKNEQTYIKDFILTHMKEMKKDDGFVFVDTGSTDNTINIIKELQKIYFNIMLYTDYPTDIPFTFNHARNFALSKVDKIYDVGIALDIDEFLTSGWRENIENIYSKNNNFILIHKRYEDTSEETGEKDNYFIQERSSIHTLSPNISWIYPVHEALTSSDPETLYIKDMSIMSIHFREQKPNKISYMKIIKDYIDSKPKKLSKEEKCYCYYVLGNEYFYANDYKNAIKIFEKYIKMVDKYNFTNLYKKNLARIYSRLGSCYFNEKNKEKELYNKIMANIYCPCRETFMQLSIYFISNNISRESTKLSRIYFNNGMENDNMNDSYTVLKLFWDDTFLNELNNEINKYELLFEIDK